MRQQVRENNQELRILESQLRTAYVSKALAAQKREREAMALAEKIQDKEENEILEKARLSHIEQMRKEHEIDREKKKQLHKDLTKQIISAHQQHQRLYEEFLREKYYLDEIAQRVKEELIELAQKKIEIKEKTKKEMDAFRLVKKELERVEKIETEEENIRIFEYCQQRDQKIADEEKRCQELEKNRKNLNEKMVAELTELEVSLKAFNFVSKSCQERMNMSTIWDAWPQAFQQHRIHLHRIAVIFKGHNSVLVHIHFLNHNVSQIVDCFVDSFVLQHVNELLKLH